MYSSDTSVCQRLYYWLHDRGSIPGKGNDVFYSLHHRVWTGSGPIQPPIQCVPGALIHVINRPGREADRSRSPPSSAEVKNAWSYTSSPSVRLHGVTRG